MNLNERIEKLLKVMGRIASDEHASMEARMIATRFKPELTKTLNQIKEMDSNVAMVESVIEMLYPEYLKEVE